LTEIEKSSDEVQGNEGITENIKKSNTHILLYKQCQQQQRNLKFLQRAVI